MPKEGSALEEVRSHIEYLKEEGSVVFSQEISSFPNTDRIFQRVDFIVAPAVNIPPSDIEGLDSFQNCLEISRRPIFYSTFFHRTVEDGLRFGRWDYEDLISGQRKSINTVTTSVSDPETAQKAAKDGVQFATVEEEVLKGPIRRVSIRPIPSLGLARQIAEYEDGFLNRGMGFPDGGLGLRFGLTAEQIKSIEEGRFPFTELDEIVRPFAGYSASARARKLETMGQIDRLAAWAENSERMFFGNKK